MTTDDIAKVLAVVKARYGDKFKYNDAASTAWEMVLDDVSYSDVMTVLPTWFKSEEWPPDPAQVRNAVLDTATALPTTDEAWRMVMDRIKSTYPGHHSPTWDVPKEVALAVLDIGGLRAVRVSEKPADMEKRFRAAYSERRQREVRLTALPGGLREMSA